MAESLRPLPDTESLTRTLQAFDSYDPGVRSLTIVDRQPNRYASSAPSEIVTCRLGTGEELRLFCKYDPGPAWAVGHRGGTSREAMIYHHVLAPMGLRPRYFGSHTIPGTGDTWLFLEYLGEPLRISKGPQPQSMRLAAEWIGRFHRAMEERAADPDLAFLPRYDADYYVSWAKRASRMAGDLQDEFPWFAAACNRAPELLSSLASGAQTVIHGEYYSQNILLITSCACPIDWESAAVGAGEIDLASLTQGWEIELQRECEHEYCASRWSEATRDGFEVRYEAAKLYWSFRWLGGGGGRQLDPESRWYLAELLAVSRRAGYVA